MTAIIGYRGQVLVSTLPSVQDTTPHQMTNQGDNQTYVTPNYTKRYWDNSQSVTIQTSADSGATWQTQTTGFTIQYVGGTVFFLTPNSPTLLVRVNGYYYFAYSILGDCKEWTASIDANVVDITAFNTAGWKSQLQVLRSASVKISKYWVDNTFETDLGSLIIVSLYPDSTTNNRYEGYGWIKGDSIKTPVNNVVEEEITIDIDGQLYYATN